MSALLSFDDAPPFSVPLRFFLTAPVHGVLAGLLLVWQGEAIYTSRWSPEALALTHLLTIGVLMQVMMGALFQFLPVAAGATIAGASRWAGFVHPALNVGVLALAAGFLMGRPEMLALAGLSLACAVGAFLFATLRAVLPARNTSPTIPALKIALAALAVVSALGLYLLAVVGYGASGRPEMLTAQHAAWGIVGWSGLLIAGVSWVVVPMFQLTPPYRPAFARFYAPALAVLLVAWTIAQATGTGSAIAGLFLATALVAYAIVTLLLQRRSKRPRADVTVLYWRLGMAFAIAAAGIWALAMLVPEAAPSRAVFLVAWLAIPGALAAVICGMQYKIVPFLCWLHLQNRASQCGSRAPHMGVFLGEAAMRRQFFAHAAAVALLVASAVEPMLTRPAGLVLAVSFVLLAANLGKAVRVFLGRLAEMPAAAGGGP